MKTGRSYGGRSAAARLADRRTRLLDAATALYGQAGYRNTSVRTVCQAAGMTERHFYEAFVNSEALLTAAFEASVEGLLTLMAPLAASTEGDREDRIRQILTAYYRRIQQKPDAARLFLIETIGVSAALDRAFAISLHRLTEPLVRICDPDRIGPLSRDPLLRRGVAGGLLHVATAWIEAAFDRSLEEVVNAAIPIAMIGCD